jgi:Arc/MetJ-type ribon-helix-helix transcriptional regulator
VTHWEKRKGSEKMSSRAVRKALRKMQQEDLKKKLDPPEQEEDVESEEEQTRGISNPFAMVYPRLKS